MVEKGSFPGRLEQYRNFVHGHREIKKAKEKYKFSGILSGIIYGLDTLVPEIVERSGFLADPDRQKLADGLLFYQITINDRLDFEHSQRSNLNDLIKYCRTRESETRAKLDRRLATAKPEFRQIIDQSVLEVEIVEKYIANKRSNLSFADIEKYRNLVNAISICAVTGTILGPDLFALRLSSLPEDKLNWPGIYEKYSWMFSSDYNNDFERVILIMHNLAMAGQIDDDWYGRHIDRQLGIPSFASAAMIEVEHDPAQAKAFLDGIHGVYLQNVLDLGLDKFGLATIDKIQRQFQKFASHLTTSARCSKVKAYRNFLQSNVVPRLSLREKEFSKGNL